MKVCFLQQQYEIIYKHPYVYVDGVRGDYLQNTIWNTLYDSSVYANIHLFIMNLAFSQYIIEQVHQRIKHEHFDLDIQVIRSDAGPIFRIALDYYSVDLRLPNPQAPFAGIPYCLRYQPGHPLHLTPIFDDFHMSWIQPFINRLQFWHSIVDKHWTEGCVPVLRLDVS